MNSIVALIARREIVSRWQQKGYRIGLGGVGTDRSDRGEPAGILRRGEQGDVL